MTEKQSIHLKMPNDKYDRMAKTMKRERINNKTAFIISAIDAACGEHEEVSAAEKLERALSILVENARIDREQAAKRHIEVMAWLDTLADAVLGGEESDIREFKSIVQQKIQQRRGTN